MNYNPIIKNPKAEDKKFDYLCIPIYKCMEMKGNSADLKQRLLLFKDCL